MSTKELPKTRPRTRFLDKLLLAALVLLALVSMRSCVATITDAIGLTPTTHAEQSKRAQSELASD